MYSFPARSWRSDQHARYVAEALKRASAGENFMVSVVTTMSAHVYVALSGSKRDKVETALAYQLSFANSLEKFKLGKKAKNELDSLKSKGTEEQKTAARRELKLDDAARSLQKANFPWGIYKVVTKLSSLNQSLSDPKRPSVRDRISIYEEMIRSEKASTGPKKPVMVDSLRPTNNPLNYPMPRDCAEPKILQGIYEAGERIMGMTTIWYGRQPNPYPDPSADRVPGTFDLARPCEYCALNERRIMIHYSRR